MIDVKCDAPECDREMGHPMPHGHALGPLILAPYSDLPRQAFDDGEPIPCNSCGAPLILDPQATRAACSSCTQRVTIDGDGWTETVVPKLYPSKMTDPKMLRESGQYQIDQWQFFDTLRLRFGLMGQEEYDARRAEDREKLAQFIRDEVEPLEKKPGWLQRLFGQR